MIDHFSDVRERTHNLSTDVRKGKFRTFCMSEWPAFNIGWPREGTFQLPIILQVKAVIFREKPHGHPGQIPYILVWQDMIENPPSWLKPFLLPKAEPTSEILALRNPTLESDKETESEPKTLLSPVLQGTPTQDLIFPAPYQVSPAPSAPPAEASGCPGSAAPPPRWRGPMHGPVAGTRGQTHWAAPAPNRGPADSTVLPLHAMGPPSETGGQLMLYWPFSTSDLYKCRTQHAKFSNNPKDLIGLLDTVLFTHQPPGMTASSTYRFSLPLRKESESGWKPGSPSWVWPKLRALYETGPPPDPHRYRLGDRCTSGDTNTRHSNCTGRDPTS
ncbi:uncharacterized protein LOC125084874 [Lutra lutra]|uniref:uncharacterized protein LOC125084874 n=1 Tax=Lutra lutra TaxID=9657 RepID=UPI001FD3C4BF|nr:uncharacterized protein LOC125084874 [Lutra lutra]